MGACAERRRAVGSTEAPANCGRGTKLGCELHGAGCPGVPSPLEGIMGPTRVRGRRRLARAADPPWPLHEAATRARGVFRSGSLRPRCLRGLRAAGFVGATPDADVTCGCGLQLLGASILGFGIRGSFIAQAGPWMVDGTRWTAVRDGRYVCRATAASFRASLLDASSRRSLARFRHLSLPLQYLFPYVVARHTLHHTCIITVSSLAYLAPMPCPPPLPSLYYIPPP